jgi:hypothetical protein
MWKDDKHHSSFTLVRKWVTVTFANLIYSQNECVRAWNAWIILQIWVGGWRSINGSMVALKLLFMHNLNIPCWTSNCHEQAKLDLSCFFITPQHFWLVIPSFQYFQMFSKRSPHNWIATNNTSPWHQRMHTRNLIVVLKLHDQLDVAPMNQHIIYKKKLDITSNMTKLAIPSLQYFHVFGKSFSQSWVAVNVSCPWNYTMHIERNGCLISSWSIGWLYLWTDDLANLKNTWHNFKYDKTNMVNLDIIYGQHLINFRLKIFACHD